MFVLSTILRLNSTLWNGWKPFTSIKFSVYDIKRKQHMNSISWCLNHVVSINKLTDIYMLFLCIPLRRWNVSPWVTYVDVANSSDVNLIFYAPEIEDRGVYCFYSVGHSVILSLSFCPLWNFNLANKFWTVNARTLIFHMNIPCYKTFPWVPLFLILWPWPWILTHFKRKL